MANATIQRAAQRAGAASSMKRDTGAVAAAKSSDAQKTAIINLIKDTNNDGKVSKSERKAYDQQLEQFRAEIDKNGDGELSFAEQVNFAERNQQITASEISNFLNIDKNQNGKITQAERDAYAVYQATLVRASKQP